MIDKSHSWSMEGDEGPGGTPSGVHPPLTPTYQAPPPPPPMDPERDGPAWERRRGMLDLAAMFTTVRDVLVDAPRTFATMVREGGLGGPLIYLLILGTISGWVGMLWGVLWNQALGATALGMGGLDLSQFGIEAEEALTAMMSSGLLQLFEAVALPAIILVIFFIEAAIFHLMLLVVGGAEQPFETTARVVAYVTGSTALFQMVPFCGGLIGLVWSIVVLIIGLAHAHETSMGRSAAAVLLPLFLCCLCCIALITVAAMGLSQVAGGGL